MSSKTFKLDALSSFIQYSGAWRKGGTSADDSISRYDSGTFFFTCADGDSADVVFTGTEFNLVGALRPNHGAFTVLLDGQSQGTFNLTMPGSDPGDLSDSDFQRTLWNWKGSQGEHRVSIRNSPSQEQITAGNNCFDIDYLNWTSTVTSQNDFTVQDSNSAHFVYDSSWSTQLGSLPSFDQSTGHVAREGSASVSISFKGDRIKVVGPVGKSFSGYSAQLDGDTEQYYNASRNTENDDASGQILFAADGLGDGDHTLKLKRNDSRSNQAFAVDYAVMDASANGGDSKSSKLSGGAIAGIAVGAVAGLLLLCLLVFLLVRRRKRMQERIDLVAADSNPHITQYPHPSPPPPQPQQTYSHSSQSYDPYTPHITAQHQTTYSSSPSRMPSPELPPPDFDAPSFHISGGSTTVSSSSPNLAPGRSSVTTDAVPPPPSYRKGR